MRFKKEITLLVMGILLLAVIAAAFGVFSNQGPGQYEFKTVRGETVKIYGKGIYRNDSVSVAAQGIAQDTVTLLLSVPLLALSLYLYRKNSLKGKLLLAGTLGYFLYTYASYAFLAMYNQLFLIYVVLMSASFFAFTMTMMSFDIQRLDASFSDELPVKFIGGFQIFLATAVGLMWLGRIVPPLTTGGVPLGLEHYSTLAIQVMDLGFVVPAAMLSGLLVLRRKPLGLLLASILTIKGISMLTAITAMIISQAMAGVQMSIVEIVLFPLFNIIVIYCLILIMKNIREPKYNNPREMVV